LADKGIDTPITLDIINLVTTEIRQINIKSPVLKFSGQISNVRALLYAYMCGGNTHEVNELELLAGCNRFGVENPVQVVYRRLSFFGNDD